MKFFIIAVGFVVIVHVVNCTDKHDANGKIVLDANWKFRLGDSINYLKVGYGDSHWNSIAISKSWQKQGFNYVGFAWYRIKVLIPSSLKDSNIDSIKFYLGKIKDCDQVFLNGSILGENGRVISGTGAIDSSFTYLGKAGIRKYVISVKDARILWDKENLLAIRVFDKGERGGGGLVANTPLIGIVGLEDSIEFSQSFYKVNASTGQIDTNLTMINRSSQIVSGMLYIKSKLMETGQNNLKKSLPIKLKPRDSILLPIYLPMTFEQTKLSLIFKELNQKKTIRDSLIVPFVLLR